MRFLIITVCLSQFCGAFMGSALNVLVPYLAADYAVQPQDISWLINVFTMCAAAFLLPASALASFLGNQRLYRTGCILAVASTVLIPFCPNFTLLMAGRALQGMAFSLLFCTAMAVLSANIDREHRATAIGLATGAVYAGLSCGPFLSGYLVELFGWPSVFFLAAGGQFIAFLLAGRIRKDPRRSRSLHWRKMLMCFAGFLLVLLSGSLLHQTAEAIVCALAGLVLLVLYFRAEERSHEPLCRLSFIAGNKSLSFALLASCFNYLCSFSISFLLALHLQFVQGFDASFTGTVLVTQPLLMMIFASGAGLFMRRFNAHLLTLTGMGMVMMALLLLTGLDANTPLFYCILAQVVTGVGFGLFSPANTAIVMDSVEPQHYALASSLQSLTRTCGQALSMTTATMLLTSFIDARQGTPLYTQELSYTISTTFMISAAFAAAGTVACVCGFKTRPVQSK